MMMFVCDVHPETDCGYAPTAVSIEFESSADSVDCTAKAIGLHGVGV